MNKHDNRKTIFFSNYNEREISGYTDFLALEEMYSTVFASNEECLSHLKDNPEAKTECDFLVIDFDLVNTHGEEGEQGEIPGDIIAKFNELGLRDKPKLILTKKNRRVLIDMISPDLLKDNRIYNIIEESRTNPEFFYDRIAAILSYE